MRHILKAQNGRYKKLRPNFTLEELKEALNNYHPRRCITGLNNPLYVNGAGEPRLRIRINGFKVQMAHLVWMVYNQVTELPKGYEIIHKNGNKRDDRIENLRLINSKRNGTSNLNNQLDLKGVKNTWKDQTLQKLFEWNTILDRLKRKSF